MSSKYNVVPFRMSPEEKEQLKTICQDLDLSMAQWMRRMIKREFAKMMKRNHG